MGSVREVLFVGTGGLSGLAVKANSKTERTAKAAERQVRLQQQQMRGSQRTTTSTALWSDSCRFATRFAKRS